MRAQQSVFCQCHVSRSGYHTRTDWLQYRINLVTQVPVDFQQKTDLTLNDRLDPHIILGVSARTWVTKWCLLYAVS